MRKEVGTELRVFNGRDGEWIAILTELNKKNGFIVLDHKVLEQKQSSDIWVLASPVKKEAFDLMIEKATELGASRFIPVSCERTVMHKINQERLQAISIEASEQCERLDIMTVDPLIPLKSLLNSFDSTRKLIFCIERKSAPSLAETTRKLSGNSLAILIGPEGGFSDQEVDSIEKFDYINPVSLGARILRAETALIAALAVIQLSDK